jgi:tetratricopeptide (TPR) repeat protein
MLKRILSHFVGGKKPANAEAMLRIAHELLEQEQFQKALPILKDIVANFPGNSSALNLLGFALSEIGQVKTGIECIESAIAINSAGNGYHSNLAEALVKLGDTARAEQAFRKQTEVTPDFGPGYLQLARFLTTTGRAEEALEVYRNATKAIPDLDPAHVCLAWHSLLELKDFTQTIKILEPVLQRNQLHGEARLIAARARLSLNNFSEAERLLRALVKDEPDNIDALVGLGHIMLLMARGDEAEACFRLALGLDPDNSQAASFLASLLLDTGKIEQAGDLLEIFVNQHPDDMAFRRCLGRQAFLSGNHEEALKHYEFALEVNPQDIGSLEQIANIKFTLGQPEESLALMRKALSLNPRRQMTRYNYAFALLISGKFRQGLVEFESRLRIPYEEGTPFNLRAVHTILDEMKRIPTWDGTASLRGKRILVWREQGLGDSLMMLRFLPQLKKLGPAKLGAVVSPELALLTESIDVADEIIPVTEWNKDYCTTNYDFNCSMMSLPYLLRVNLNSLGACVPYLSIPEEQSGYWRRRLTTRMLASGKLLNIGLVWAGNPKLAADRARSIALRELSPLIDIKKVQWISLQKGPKQSEAKELGDALLDFMDECADFTETAALVMALDLVIAVDTSIVHLAGALGKPVWMLNRSSSEWRWMRDRNDSPWYPSLQLFNQKVGESWKPVIERVAEAVDELLRTTAR